MSKKVNIIECCQKLLFMVKELHNRGFEELQIIPSIAPSGLYWRCEFRPKRRSTKHLFYSSGAQYNYFGWKNGKKMSSREMADRFQKDFSDMLDICKHSDKYYSVWYSNMLDIIGNDKLPYAYSDYFSSNDYWATTGGEETIPIPPTIKNYTGVIKSVLFGVAVGDALGVPVEFNSRQTISGKPVTDMIGYGTYNLPAGTWSDDSSLTFCLAEALTQQDFNLNTIGQNFVNWAYQQYWTPRGRVFDIGIATRQSIDRLAKGEKPEFAGGFEEFNNGNGSLMRILPLLFYIFDKPINERYEITKQVSSITHGHIRSVIACFYYLEFAKQIFEGKNKFDIYQNLQTEITNFLTSLAVNPTELALFDRLLKANIYERAEAEIKSSGYVLHTLEASIWCLLTTDNYKAAVLKAVNLGDDTDTTGAVTGGLAGLLYGIDNIPKTWIEKLARYEDINNLAERLADKNASR
jgi:ADP-ribosylglycohydrolase